MVPSRGNAQAATRRTLLESSSINSSTSATCAAPAGPRSPTTRTAALRTSSSGSAKKGTTREMAVSAASGPAAVVAAAPRASKASARAQRSVASRADWARADSPRDAAVAPSPSFSASFAAMAAAPLRPQAGGAKLRADAPNAAEIWQPAASPQGRLGAVLPRSGFASPALPPPPLSRCACSTAARRWAAGAFSCGATANSGQPA
mmetsp:Transcript_76073/g.219683  ORF Transcript_76073/g.219683 Transcript_76073/m.219683 type:complete len:205 (-) Transcript_76073:334-948(-)